MQLSTQLEQLKLDNGKSLLKYFDMLHANTIVDFISTLKPPLEIEREKNKGLR